MPISPPAGRLVVPFDLVLPSDAGYYIVAPEETADTKKIALFRDWLLRSAATGTEPSASRQDTMLLRKAAARARRRTRATPDH